MHYKIVGVCGNHEIGEPQFPAVISAGEMRKTKKGNVSEIGDE